MTTSAPSPSEGGGGGATWTRNTARDRTGTSVPVPADVREFHRRLPGYAPTALTGLPQLADELGVAHVFAKDESNRLGLPAFKGLGASWAIHRALQEHRRREGASDPTTIVTATDGNHGRAVARFSRLLGQRAHVFVPDGVHPVAVRAIADEGATVTHAPGSYDDAVRTAAQHAADHDEHLLVQDTAGRAMRTSPGGSSTATRPSSGRWMTSFATAASLAPVSSSSPPASARCCKPR